MARKHPNSFLSFYRSINSVCAVQPYAPHLRQAAQLYRAAHISHALSATAEHHTTLTIALEPASSFSPHFKAAIKYTVPKFNRVLVLPTTAGTRENLKAMSEILMAFNRTFSIVNTENDEETVIFGAAAGHLLVQSGDLSALIALTSENKVFFPVDFHHMTKHGAYRYALKDASIVPRNDYNLPFEQVEALKAFHPKPSCCTYEGYGQLEIEKKLVCQNLKGYASGRCWIMSVGSRGQFEFEEEAFKKTSCMIHTFDCTGEFIIPDHLKGRVFMHKKCIGGRKDPRKEYMSIGELVRYGARASGLPDGTVPTLAKIDAEGFEFPSLLDLVWHERDLIPDQIAVEVHMHLGHSVGYPMNDIKFSDGNSGSQMSVSKALEFVGNMSAAGYELVNKLDSLACPAVCAEVSWVRRESLPPAVGKIFG